ncbi:MAG: chromosomal replication initiator protein DnaA [Clostridia bacterium]|nr:chromosomal replication initiator protein DnaA [Clostridia bacterium]MBQ7352366.1 chromosomal replication initiator protein DnaA [Clostridia bacterium]
MDKQQIWANALEKLQKTVSTISYDLWVKSLEPLDFKDGVFYLTTTSETAKQRIMAILKGDIHVALTDCSDEIKEFAILDPDEKEAYNKNQELAVQTEQTRVPGVNSFNPRHTFDNFIVGNSNKYVYAACKGIAENPFSRINPLYIYGGCGLGKTHLLHAIGNYINKNRPELKVMYCTCEKYITDYVKSLQGNFTAKNNFKEKYRSLDVLIIDDIQSISKAESTQEEFFHNFNDLYENGKQIIIASDCPPRDLQNLHERLRSRFSMGLIQDIQSPDYETRLAILLKKAQEENYSVSDEVIEYLAKNFDTNIREIEGLLSKVWFYASLNCKKTATMEDLQESLKDHDFSDRQNLTADRIIDCVCKYFNVKKEDLLGKKKNKEIVEPRQICMYTICNLLDMPLLDIGKIFGKDHTTVIHARDKISELMEENQRIKVAVSDIKALATKS